MSTWMKNLLLIAGVPAGRGGGVCAENVASAITAATIVSG